MLTKSQKLHELTLILGGVDHDLRSVRIRLKDLDCPFIVVGRLDRNRLELTEFEASSISIDLVAKGLLNLTFGESDAMCLSPE